MRFDRDKSGDAPGAWPTGGCRPGPQTRRRLIVLSLALILSSAPAALHAASQLAIGQGSASIEASAVVPVSLTTDTPIVAIQFDVQYDGSLLLAGAPLLLGGATNHVIVSSSPTNGVQRILVYSLANAPLPTGAILNLQFTAEPGSAGQVVALSITNAIAATASAASVTPLQLVPGSFNAISDVAARFSSIVFLSNGALELQLKGAEGTVFAIQISPNLRDWSPLVTNTIPAGGVLKVDDTTAPKNGARFYRAAQQ